MRLILILLAFSFTLNTALANTNNTLTGGVSDPLVEAQERLTNIQSTYKTIQQQEDAIKDMRKATKLSLKAAKLRAKAESLQAKADALVNKANQQALSRGLYITNPVAPVMMEPPPQAANPSPVPGQPINIFIPRQDEVSTNDGPPVPAVRNF